MAMDTQSKPVEGPAHGASHGRSADPYVYQFVACRGVSPVRAPSPRVVQSDIVNPTFNDLHNLALRRVVGLVQHDADDPPPRLFPTAEHVQEQFFSIRDWSEFGDLETERARLTYTLSRYPERGLPSSCTPVVEALIFQENVLTAWPRAVAEVKIGARKSMRRALDEMIAQMPSSSGRSRVASKEAILSRPVAYASRRDSVGIEIVLWRRGLVEVAQRLKCGRVVDCVEGLLQIHAFLRDPIGGLETYSGRQVDMFMSLLRAFENEVQVEALSSESWQSVAAQLALESSFLAIPKLQKVAYIHFAYHQQLPYVYVTLDRLPRAEFSLPRRVLEIVHEMLLSTTSSSLCHIAPITVAYCPALDPGQKAFKVIIDGNNRVAAIALLRFLATQNLDELEHSAAGLEYYCDYHGLGIKWLLDIRDVVTELCADDRLLNTLKACRNIVAQFKTVKRVPALVVQEPSFHTVWMGETSDQRSVLLQPMHQTLYNERSLCFAIPAKQQSHGRPLGYKPLPLK